MIFFHAKYSLFGSGYVRAKVEINKDHSIVAEKSDYESEDFLSVNNLYFVNNFGFLTFQNSSLFRLSYSLNNV